MARLVWWKWGNVKMWEGDGWPTCDGCSLSSMDTLWHVHTYKHIQTWTHTHTHNLHTHIRAFDTKSKCEEKEVTRNIDIFSSSQLQRYTRLCLMTTRTTWILSMLHLGLGLDFSLLDQSREGWHLAFSFQPWESLSRRFSKNILDFWELWGNTFVWF